jgi:hypothetical protein
VNDTNPRLAGRAATSAATRRHLAALTRWLSDLPRSSSKAENRRRNLLAAEIADKGKP